MDLKDEILRIEKIFIMIRVFNGQLKDIYEEKLGNLYKAYMIEEQLKQIDNEILCEV